MIYVKSFTSTRTSDGFTPVSKDIKHVTEEATEEMQCWIDEQEDFTEKHFNEGYTKIISTSTQLVANECFVSYAITAIIEQDGKDEE